MRFAQLVGPNAPAEEAVVRILNGETSATMLEGAPACYIFNGTDDGVRAVLPNTGTASRAHSLFAGVVGANIPAGAFGPAIVFGYANTIRLVRATRAASTDAWASTPAIGIGDLLVVNTVHNAFTHSATGAITAFMAAIVAGQTLASATTLVSSSAGTGDTRLADIAAIRGFVKVM